MIKITRIITFPDVITNFFNSSNEQRAIFRNYEDNMSILSDEVIDNRIKDLTVTYITIWSSEEKVDEYDNLPEVIENRKNRLDYYKNNNITMTETKEVI
jgi:hypothetical protein